MRLDVVWDGGRERRDSVTVEQSEESELLFAKDIERVARNSIPRSISLSDFSLEPDRTTPRRLLSNDVK